MTELDAVNQTRSRASDKAKRKSEDVSILAAPPPKRKVWFQKWEKYTSSSAVVAAAGHFCGRRRSDAADGSILDASLTANQPKLQTDIPGVRAEEISIIYDSV